MWCLWICLHDCGINSSGLLIASQGESRNLLLMAIPLKCLCCCCGKKRQGFRQSLSIDIVTACFIEPWQPQRQDPAPDRGISALRVLSTMFQPKKHLTGKWWQEVFALELKCSPKGKEEEIKILSVLGALWSERISSQRDFFPFRERLLLFVSTKWWWTISFAFCLRCYFPVIHQSFSSSGNCVQSPLTLSHGPREM